MQEQGVDGWRVPEGAIPPEAQADIADARGQGRAAEIVGAFMAQRLAGCLKNIQHLALVVRRDIGLEIADFDGRRRQVFKIAALPGPQQAAVGFNAARREMPRGAEVEQHQPAARLVVAIVGEIGIGLHAAKLEYFAEQQLKKEAQHPVALGLRRRVEGFDRYAVHETHGQDVRRGQRAMHGGQREIAVVGQAAAIALQVGRFLQVVGLVVQLPLRFFEQGREIEGARQQAGDAEQRRHVIDIAGNALPHAGILHLDRQALAALQLRRMHLANRRGGQRGEGKALEMPVPARPPGGFEHRHQLAHRHGLRIGAQPGQDGRQFGRHQVAGIHRQQLPDLHGGAAQARQLVGDTLRVARRQQQVADARPVAARPLAHAFGQHAAGHPGGQAAQARQPGQAAARYGRSLVGLAHRGPLPGVDSSVSNSSSG